MLYKNRQQAGLVPRPKPEYYSIDVAIMYIICTGTKLLDVSVLKYHNNLKYI